MFSRQTLQVLFPAIAISLGGSFHYGFQLTMINPTEDTFRRFINSSFYDHYDTYLTPGQWTYLWPLVVNTQMIASLISTLCLKYFLDRWSRKRGFYLTNSVILISAAMQACSKPTNAWELFMIGRFISGLMQGLQLGIQPVYFNEISPRSIRGLIGANTGFFLEFGFLFASILGVPTILGSSDRWPYLLLIESVPSVIALALLHRFPESPKFLASRDRFEEAEESLRKLGRSEDEIKEELGELHRDRSKKSIDRSSSMSLKEIFSIPYIRKGLILGWIVVISSIFSGITAFSYFSTRILQNSGLDSRSAQYATIGMTAPCCFGALIGGSIVDRFGRRPIMLLTTGLMLLLNILFIVLAYLTRVYHFDWSAYSSIVCVSLICLSFGLGPASVMWFVTVELVPQRAKSQAHTLAMIFQRTSSVLAGVIFYPLEAAVGEFSFLMHVIPLSVALVTLAMWLPETKNRTSDEVARALGWDGREGKEDMEERDGAAVEKAHLEKF